MVIKNKPNHFLRDEEETEYKLYVVSDYEFSTNNIIINYEAATGNGGLSYSNGRIQEFLPLNGTLIANSLEELNRLKDNLIGLSDSGIEVEFNGPFISTLRTNKYFIRNLKFLFSNNDTSVEFSMELAENREANVKTVSVNLVNFETAELYKELLAARTGAEQ